MSSVRRLTSLENRSAVVLVEMYDGCHNNGYNSQFSQHSVNPAHLGSRGHSFCSTPRTWARGESFNLTQLGS